MKWSLSYFALYKISYTFSLITLHGEPYATTLSGMSLVTTEPAPIMEFLPILTVCNMFVPIPIVVPSPIVTFPAMLVPGLMEQ